MATLTTASRIRNRIKASESDSKEKGQDKAMITTILTPDVFPQSLYMLFWQHSYRRKGEL